jgi:hypothetical protein
LSNDYNTTVVDKDEANEVVGSDEGSVRDEVINLKQ